MKKIFVYSKEKAAFLFFCIFSAALIVFPKGYGLDGDGWREILSGYKLFSEHIYEPSRFPGYPIPEFLSSLLWFTKIGSVFPGIFNFISVIFSVLAIYFYASILEFFRKGDDNRIFLAVLAFGLNTLFFINSIVLMDYTWSLAFVLGAFYYILKGRNNISAILLAAAAGCRITAGIMIIPFIFYFIQLYKNQNVSKLIVRYTLIFSLLLSAIYAPLIIHYGLKFLTYYESGYPTLSFVLGRATIRVWGIIGSIAVLSGFIIIILNIVLRRRDKNFTGVNTPILWTIVLSIVLIVLLYIKLPSEAGYLLPVVPFILILFYLILSKTFFQIICYSIILSSFFLNIDQFGFNLQGPIIINYYKRVQETKYLDKVIPAILRKEKKSVIICEAFLPKIELSLKLKNQAVPENIKLINTLSLDSLKRNYIDKHYDIYYLRDINKQILELYKYDPRDFGGKEF